MKKLIILLMLININIVASSTPPEIKGGKINLVNWSFEEGEVDLIGKWEFYKGKIITPGNFENKKPEIIEIPAKTKKYSSIENRTVGTYRTKIEFRLRETNRIFGIRLSNISSNFKLWVDGELLSEYGNMMLIDNIYYSGTRDEIVFFKPSKKEIEIVFNVNNDPFIVNNGFEEKISIGYKENILRSYNSVKYGLFLLSVSIVLVAVYTFLLYSFARYPRNISYFAFFSIVLAFYVLINSKMLSFINNYIQIKLRLDLLYRLELIILVLGNFLIIKYVRSFYKKPRQDIYTILLEIITGILILSTSMISNKYIILNESNLKRFFLITFMGFTFPVIYNAIKNLQGVKRLSGINFLLGITFVIITPFKEVVFFGYILTESLLIMLNYSKTFVEKQDIAMELKEINETLDEKVKRRTNQLEEKKDQLEEKTLQLQEVNSAKTKFFSVMSHEIRTPLNGIIGMSQLLYLEKLPLNIKRKIDIINNTSNHLLKIINDILDASKLEFGKMKLETSEFDLREMVFKLSDSFSYMLNEKGLVMITDIDEDVPKIMNGDSLRLRQVLLNLMSNAVKFTENGYINIEIKKEGNTLYFGVEDTGIGIKKDRAKTIFDEYSQDRLSDARKFGGTGLGLSISKQIVELMGGYLSIDIEREFGSKFFFSIPFESVVENENENLSDYTVIIIHSDYTINRYLMKLFDTWNMANIPFYSLDDAMDIELEDFRYDNLFIIIDEEIVENEREKFLDYINTCPELIESVIVLSKKNEKIKDIELAGIKRVIENPFNNSKFYNQIIHGKSHYEVNIDTELKNNNFSGKRALIVEDNEVNIEVLKDILDIFKLEVEYVTTGSEALIKILDTRYDIIFMDIELGDISGIEITELIRYGENANVNTMIIGVTAYTSDDYKNVCIESGMDGYLSKPIDYKELFTLLKKTFGLLSIDITKIEAINSDEFLKKTFDNLNKFYPKSISKIIEFINEKDGEKAKKEIHSLKGAVANLKIKYLVDAMEELENDYADIPDRKKIGIIENIELELNKLKLYYKRGESNEDINS